MIISAAATRAMPRMTHWLVPHFEKMLYDNALILDLLALVHARTKNPLYAARARETVGWLVRDMREEGAFAASEDADSEGEEGQILRLGGEPKLPRFWARRRKFLAAITACPNMAIGRSASSWSARPRLPMPRPRRASPRRGASFWPGAARASAPAATTKFWPTGTRLTIAALARAALVFEEPCWLERAAQNFDFLLAKMGAADGRIAHAYRAGKISAAGLLEDQAAMIRAGLALYEHTGDNARLDQALRILRGAETHFADGAGAFFMVADDAADVPGRKPATSPMARPLPA